MPSSTDPGSPAGYPMLKVTSPDAVIPSVYRVGQAMSSYLNNAPFIRSTSYGTSTIAIVKEETLVPGVPVVTDSQLSHLFERVKKLKIPWTNVVPSKSLAFYCNGPRGRSRRGAGAPACSASFSSSSAFVGDVTVLDGQIFSPGAEFVKCWRLLNDTGCEWPESTSLVFVAGESLMVETGPVASICIGTIAAGAEIDVWTSELKASEVPGRYVGYWMFKADGELFGNSPWIDTSVVEFDSYSSSGNSLSPSSIMMPISSSVEQTRTGASATVRTTFGPAATTEDNLHGTGLDIS